MQAHDNDMVDIQHSYWLGFGRVCDILGGGSGRKRS